MCNFSLDGPRPLGDPSCCRRVGTARPPHSVFPPPALMSPFHYCVAIHHAHGQGDFAGILCMGDVARAIITGDEAQALALLGQGTGKQLPCAPGFCAQTATCLGTCSYAAPDWWRGSRIMVPECPGQQSSLDTYQPKPCPSHPSKCKAGAGQAFVLSGSISG